MEAFVSLGRVSYIQTESLIVSTFRMNAPKSHGQPLAEPMPSQKATRAWAYTYWTANSPFGTPGTLMDPPRTSSYPDVMTLAPTCRCDDKGAPPTNVPMRPKPR